MAIESFFPLLAVLANCHILPLIIGSIHLFECKMCIKQFSSSIAAYEQVPGLISAASYLS